MKNNEEEHILSKIKKSIATHLNKSDSNDSFDSSQLANENSIKENNQAEPFYFNDNTQPKIIKESNLTNKKTNKVGTQLRESIDQSTRQDIT